MSWTIFLYGVVPLIVFVVVDAIANIKWAVISAILFAIADVFVGHLTMNVWDPGSIVAVVLIMILGWLSLRRKDDLYVKLQPIFLEVGFSIYIAYHQFFGTPILTPYLPIVQAAVPPEYRARFNDPQLIDLINSGITGLIPVLLLHAALVGWAAYKASNLTWLLVRGVGIWALIFAMVLTISFAKAFA